MTFELSLNLLFILSIICMFLLYKIAQEKEIKSSIILLSIFSLCSCLLYLVMDAPDVAMTEAALGSCITTVILLQTAQTSSGKYIKTKPHIKIIGFLFAITLCAMLLYAGTDLATYGDPTTPVHSTVMSYYNNSTYKDMGITSFVAGILASYRGYDTLGETTVIFLAGLCVVLILNSSRRITQ
jgi:multicomponent Na+:H+ antiporter subunit B